VIILIFSVTSCALFPIIWTLYQPRSIFTYPFVIYFSFLFLDRFFLSFLLPLISFNSSSNISLIKQYDNQFLGYLVYCFLLFFVFALIYLFVFTRKNALLLAQYNFDDFDLSPRLFSVSQILMYAAFILWIIVTNGMALFEPRMAYIELRKGFGYIWAFGIFAISLNASLKLIFYTLSFRSICCNLFLPYFYASKGIILSLLVPFLFYKGPHTIKLVFAKSSFRRYLEKYSFLFIFLLCLFGFVLLYRINSGFTNESAGVFDRLLNTYSSFNNANKALLEQSSEFDQIKSSIYFSSFWSWIPRAIYPDKPFAYGSALVIDYFYPGLAASGTTPSIGLGLVEFLQFGYFGLIPKLLFDFQSLLPFLLVVLLTNTSKSSYNKIKLYLFCNVLIPGGLTFHLPPLVSFLFSMFIFRLSFP